MGTDKRQRQKEGRHARVEAAMAAQRQAQNRRRLALAAGILVFVALVILVATLLTRDGGDDTATGDSTTSSLAGELESAAGKPCVAMADPVPPGAPEVPVPEGPPPTELVTEDLVVGDGPELPADPNVTVDVNYIGVSCSTGKVFDESYSGGQSAQFQLGQVIVGWQQGMAGMKVGGQRLMVIPSALGYGPDGSPPAIAPDEALVFVVDLLGFEEAPPTPTVPPAPAEGATITGDTPCPAADGSSPRTTKFEKAPPMCIDPAKSYVATFDTSAGTMKIRLDASGMPGTANNFVVLSRYHYYDGTAIFRSDPSIEILQGGSPHTNSPSDSGPGYTIPDEGGPFTYKPGQLVMARTQAPNSSGAQYFLTTGPKVSALDSQGTYLLFGVFIEGLDVAQAIMATHLADPTSQLGGAPNPPVIVNSVTIEES